MMGLSALVARTAVRHANVVQVGVSYGELCFGDRSGKQLPLGTYYRFVR